MHAVRLAAAVLLAFWSLAGNAADLSLKDIDCVKILERWARDPASVPKHLVDRCKEQMAEPAPAAIIPAPLAAAVDPCAGPNAASSVLCWGPWTALAPAAEGAQAAALAPPEIPTIDCSTTGNISDECVPQLQAQPVLAGCPAGTPCGFATLVEGATSNADVEQTSFVRFDMQPDGSSFTVDPDGANEINSVPMTAIIGPGAEGYENMRATGVAGDEQSNLVARVVRDDQGAIALASGDVWRHGNRQTRAANSGYFAWGVATTQSAID